MVIKLSSSIIKLVKFEKQMNKSDCLQSTLSKPSSKQLNKIKDRLRDNDYKAKQYQSLCHDVESVKHIHAIIPLSIKERKISKRQNKTTNSPAQLKRSKSKKQNSNKQSEESKCHKSIGEVYSELMTVKSEYKTLKISYNQLIQQKAQVTNRQQSEIEKAQVQLQKANKQLQNYRKLVSKFQQEMERIKKQCYKLVQTEKFKRKKLEQIIEQKDLMIAFLRNTIDKFKHANETASVTTANQSSFLYGPSNYNFEFAKGSINSSLMSNVVIDENIVRRIENRPQEDSLSFSRDKSKEMESIHSFLTNNDQTLTNFTKKDIVIIESNQQSLKSEPSQCLTFEQRGQDENLFIPQSKHREKVEVAGERMKSGSSIPPKGFKNKSISRATTKKLQIVTNQNENMNKQKQSIEDKKCLSISSRQRKKSNKKQKN